LKKRKISRPCRGSKKRSFTLPACSVVTTPSVPLSVVIFNKLTLSLIWFLVALLFKHKDVFKYYHLMGSHYKSIYNV
jgi:hypothetical protein